MLTGFATVAQLFETMHGRQAYYPHFVFFVAGVFLLQPFLFVLLVTLPHLIEWGKVRLINSNSERLRNWYLQPFNIACHIIAGFAAWWVNHLMLLLLNSTVEQPMTARVLPVIAATCAVLTYVGLNHLTVGQALVLARQLSWRQSGVMKWQSLQPDLIMSFLGYIVAVLWQFNPWLILPALSPLVLMYQGLMVPQLKQEAQTDGKTGLFNARHFSALYQAEMERSHRFERPMALLMADLDLLRNINNTYGHLAGDAVLEGIGRIIRETIREFDVAGRFGGEEFAIALPEAGLFEASAIAERLRAAVEAASFAVPNNTALINVTMSIGIACHPLDAMTSTDLLHQADVAVYQAKLKGRNCVVCASEVPHSLDLISAPLADRLAPPHSDTFVPRPRVGVEQDGRNGKAVHAVSEAAGTVVSQPLTMAVQPASHNGNGSTAPDGSVAPAMSSHATIPIVPVERKPSSPTQAAARSSEAKTPGLAFPLFIASVIGAGLLFAGLSFSMRPQIDPMAIGIFALLAFVAELWQVDLYGRGSISVSVAVSFAAALVTGLPGLALVCVALVVGNRLRQRPVFDKTSVYKTPFNWATHMLAGLAPAATVALLGVKFRLDNLPVLIFPVMLSAAAYFVIDTGLIATVISLMVGDNPAKVWNERYRWLSPHYLTLCTIGLFLGMAYVGLGPLGALVFTMPVLMMRVAQQQYITQTEHSVHELQRMNEELTHANAEVGDAGRTVQQLNEELFLTLSKIIDARDPYVGGHASKVADYAIAIARDLGMSSERIPALRQSGFLHDIGKIAISEAVLHKPAKLTDEEYEYIKTHAALGGEFLEMSGSLRHLAPFVRHHHERWDGNGYPDKLAAEAIPLEARILAVCDAVEAMASDRPYRKGMSLDEIIAEVKRCANTQFDPSVAAAFVRIAERERDHLIVNSAVEVQRKQARHADAILHPHGLPFNPNGNTNANGSNGNAPNSPLITGPLSSAAVSSSS